MWLLYGTMIWEHTKPFDCRGYWLVQGAYQADAGSSNSLKNAQVVVGVSVNIKATFYFDGVSASLRLYRKAQT